MRPRVFPAEDVNFSPNEMNADSGFNEAAGIPAEDGYTWPELLSDYDASMRPRVFPAEDEASLAVAVVAHELQ